MNKRLNDFYKEFPVGGVNKFWNS